MATNTQSDGAVFLYLQVSENLADVEDVQASRDNLGLGELATKDSLTASDVGAYPITGGNLGENASINVISGTQSPIAGDVIYSPWLRCCLKGRGNDQDFKDGASCLIRLIEKVGEISYIELLWDGFGSTYAFTFDQNGEFHAPSSVYAGDAFIAADGNVHGTCWDGYLNQWVSKQISESAASGPDWMKDNRTGFIFQTGRIVVSSTNGHVTFPVAFTSTPGIVLTVGTSQNMNASYYNDTTTGFDLSVNGELKNYSVSWFAFGK